MRLPGDAVVSMVRGGRLLAGWGATMWAFQCCRDRPPVTAAGVSARTRFVCLPCWFPRAAALSGLIR